MAVACLLDGRLLCLYPFNVLDLAQLPFVQQLGKFPGVDVVSPYGYGGATYEGEGVDRQIAEESLEYALQSFFAQMNVVSEFVREDLFAEHLTPRHDGEHLALQQNVVVDLRVATEERWLRYARKVRANVRHAEEAGLRVEISNSVSFLEPFLGIYYATMKRDRAKGYYFFARDKFQRLHDALQPNGGLQYALVFLQDRVISAALLLLSTDTIYSFLSGSDADYFALRPADLLNHKIITWGHDRGYWNFVVGGGVKPSDGLFQFKRAFEPDGLMDFCVRRVVWNKNQYDSLVSDREKWELGRGQRWKPEPGFFPAYRAESTGEELGSPPPDAVVRGGGQGMKLIIIGAGQHGQVVADAAIAAGFEVLGFLDDDHSLFGRQFLGVRVLGPIEAVHDMDANCVVAIGDNRHRKHVVDVLQLPVARYAAVIHPRATVSVHARVLPGAMVLAGAIVGPQAVVGGHSIINHASTIDHHNIVGAFVHVAPGCHAGGNVHIGDGAFLGIGVSVVPGATVGCWAIVGAGSVVLHDVPDSTTVVGVPARELRKGE
jgi:sugar O-acyltransferase (sialic acid O-acetyltransferase NeuD family)